MKKALVVFIDSRFALYCSVHLQVTSGAFFDVRRNNWRTNLYPLERFEGLRQCKKRRCKVCTNVTETDTVSSTIPGKTFQINHELNCDDKCLIYLLKCKICKNKYIGKTMDVFWLRWNNCKDNDRRFQRNESCMQQHFYEYFYSKGLNGFLGIVSISLIEITDGFQPKKRENYWTRTLKTLAPLGHNVESAVWHFICMLDTCFCTAILDWNVSGLRTLDTFMISYLFCLCITPVITVFVSFGDYSID